MKISKTYKIFGTTYNVAGKLEKALVIAAFVTTAIKLVSAFGMDKAGHKSIKR